MEQTDSAVETTATGSGSVDTASIAASVIADADGGGAPESQPAAATTTSEQPDPNAAQADPDDFDALPAERVDSLGRKRENAIPHSRVKAMIEKRERKLIAEVAKAYGITKAEAELKLEDVMGTITERNTRFTDLESRNKNFDVLEPIMENEPDRFIQMLGMTNPAYKPFADFLQHREKFAEFIKGQGQAPVTAATDDPEPLPDIPIDPANPDGPKTYSIEQLSKARAWDRRQAQRDALAQVEGRLKPFEEERAALAKQKRDREQAEAVQRQANEAINRRLEKARKWPGFTESEKEILDWIGKNEGSDFIDGYMAIHMPKLTTNKAKVREELIAEMNAAPKSTSTPTSPAAAKTDKPKTTADYAREVMREFAA